MKILWADADGLCLFTKRLEEGQFIWPAVRDGKIAITRSQLAMLNDKLDWRQPKTTGELYAVEEEIRGLPTAERLAARQSQSKPLLISLHEWLVAKSATLSKKSRLGEAFAYVLNQWNALCYYSDDGLAEPDNNVAERALRAVCLGKKNYIFFGSDHGGERGALLYGLIGTCRLNGINPEAYLRHILSVLPEWPSNKVAELLP